MELPPSGGVDFVYQDVNASPDEDFVSPEHCNLSFEVIPEYNFSTPITCRKNHSPCVGKTKGTLGQMKMAILSHLYVGKSVVYVNSVDQV